ncbi:hypothetical protein GUITHDRAFT_141626 [Guillardia theta CCMP2712]|uniref:TAZ-type domain-containing protein n=1 Tax=Guillardia theta (strain CCMP2712) TaxID=905079 RepID=L1J031_GUITC|nr:hypothetical protein GUITHDRAFT_141626 [Guillardia theta CCMP2712]EKX41873.1 hypothetical protein GUITHDRAFT_141626 [Guillardia theta CCMP2712]|eukprot:XP_005828853.1 hypothetical protein GUITHDRAFT_141626 [Guillardia theta CCMP2712]
MQPIRDLLLLFLLLLLLLLPPLHLSSELEVPCCSCHQSEAVYGEVVRHEKESYWKSKLCTECAGRVSMCEDSISLLLLKRRCRNCTKFASFADPIFNSMPVHCKAHKMDSEVDVVHKSLLCREQGCSRQGVYGHPLNLELNLRHLMRKQVLFCKQHRKEVQLRGLPEARILHCVRLWASQHKPEDCVDTVHRKCQWTGCGRRGR